VGALASVLSLLVEQDVGGGGGGGASGAGT